MALSPADFYSYSRATGAPIPEDPEERARMAPEVLAYRRNQLKAPQQQTEEGFNFNDVLAVGAGLATAGLAALAARRGVRALKEAPKPLQPETIARAEQAAKTQDFGAVGNIVRDLSEVPAVAPSKRTQPEGQFTELSVVRQPTTFKAFSERVSPVDISEVPGLTAYKELQEAELYSQTPEAQLEERRATRAVQAAESKEKALGKNVLLELRRELEEEQSAQSEFSPRKYAEQTGALEPVDATSVQTSQQPLVADQQNNAVLSGEDQFTGKDLRALQRDTDVIAGRTSTEDQLNTQEAAAQQFLAKKINSAPDIDLDATYTYQDLKKAGLPDFEIDARIQAYASTGDKLLMNPNVNSKTLGHNEFLKVLGVRNARINDRMQLIEGELVNPEGDVRMSAFARQQPSVSQQLEDVESRPYEPISQGLTGLAGGVGTAPAIFKKDIKLSEQYETSIKNFRSEWDRNVRENAMRAAAGEGDYSDIIMPARAERLVDTDDLDIPVRIETDDEGRVLNRTLYRDILPVEVVQRIESGQKTLLDVPFMVNKGRAYLDYKRNPSLANRAVAKDYQRTGRALVGKYQTIVGPYEGSKYIPELQEGRYFEPGETGVTPARGPGSQKGKLVGGVIEEPVTQTLAPLKFIKKSEGGRVFQQAVELGGTNPVNTLDELQQLGDVQDFKGNVLRVSPEQQANFVVTQPMSVRRVTPVTQQLLGGQTAQRMVQRVARKTGKPFSAPLVTIEDVLVEAPLQVVDARTDKEIASAASISRSNLNQTLDRLAGQFAKQSGRQPDNLTLAKLLDDELALTQNIRLPVLSSNTAFNFIENVRGRPASRATSISYATTSDLGDIYPIAADQIEDFIARNKLPALGQRKAGQTRFASTTLTRQAVGPQTFGIQEAPKGLIAGITAEEEDTRRSMGSILEDAELGFTGGRTVELGSSRKPGMLQRSLAPAQTGVGAELQALREQLGKIEGKEPPVSTEALPSNLEAVTQQLLAQSKRRAGKRRNR